MSASGPPRPSSRLHPTSPFSWQAPTAAPADAAERRARVARAELAQRAGLLFRLGFSEAAAAARLTAAVAWEYDPASAPGRGAHRRPESLSDAAIAALVAETYARRPG